MKNSTTPKGRFAYLRFLYQEYLQFTGKADTSDALWAFLESLNCLPSLSELPQPLPSTTQYGLTLKLCTDGDFFCDFQHERLFHEDETYLFSIAWDCPLDKAAEQAVKLLREFKEATKASRENIQDDLDALFDRTIENIQNGKFAYYTLSGNYDGTEIVFGPIH